MQHILLRGPIAGMQQVHSQIVVCTLYILVDRCPALPLILCASFLNVAECYVRPSAYQSPMFYIYYGLCKYVLTTKYKHPLLSLVLLFIKFSRVVTTSDISNTFCQCLNIMQRFYLLSPRRVNRGVSEIPTSIPQYRVGWQFFVPHKK